LSQIFLEGRGSLARVGDIFGGRSVFLVSGRGSFLSSGAKEVFDSCGVRYSWWSGFCPNPKKEHVEAAYSSFRSGGHDFVCAVGGGSAIDVAKAVKLMHARDGGRGLPLAACPTTAGSGSESTHFIVYYEGLEKRSEGDPSVTLPDFVVLDPNLLAGLPHRAFASSVLDALSQSVESYWSVNSTRSSREMASRVMSTIKEFGVSGVVGRDRVSEEMLMAAANVAGRCIEITKTTACHSFAYPMTSHFGIDHGYACALTLGKVLEYNSMVDEHSINDPRGVEFVRGIASEIAGHLGFGSVGEAGDWIAGFISELGLENDLNKLDVDCEIVIQKGFNPDRVVNNPRVVTKADLEFMLRSNTNR